MILPFGPPFQHEPVLPVTHEAIEPLHRDNAIKSVSNYRTPVSGGSLGCDGSPLCCVIELREPRRHSLERLNASMIEQKKELREPIESQFACSSLSPLNWSRYLGAFGRKETSATLLSSWE